MSEEFELGVYSARLQHLPHCHDACPPPCPVLAVYEALESLLADAEAGACCEGEDKARLAIDLARASSPTDASSNNP